MAVSQDFAPPFRLIVPYFVLGAIFFILSSLALFSVDISHLSSTDSHLLSWVHLFLLGFVMMIIFGAMAQLVPVVLEVGHFAVDLYYVIYPLLTIGTIMMGVGFLSYPWLLPFGGMIVLISLMIFLFETFLTILKVKKLNLVMSSVLIANTFLFFGLIFGIMMAMGYSGTVSVDIPALLHAHIYLVFVGYVGITIMGMSLILLPMFWLSHSFSWKPVENALYIISAGVISVVISSIFDIIWLRFVGFGLSITAFGFYFYQIYLIYTTRVRIENDVYFYSLIFSYLSLFVSLILGLIYLMSPNSLSPNLLLGIGWLLFLGFVTFIIIGHLYKIVPFLVWYQKFSPLIGKQKVPMLADMVPTKSASFQFVFTSSGVIISSIGIFAVNNSIFQAGVYFLFIGSVFVYKDLKYMINYE